MIKQVISSIVAVFFFSQVVAQNATIKGTILDETSKQAIPFASVGIEGSSKGTISNEQGNFTINVSEENRQLVVSHLGYEDALYTLSDRKEPLVIYLKEWSYNLPETVVRPKAAVDYIKEAIANHPSTPPSSSFQTQAYFSFSNIAEQNEDALIQTDEAVFLTYYPGTSTTTVGSNSQLLLHRYSDNEVDIEFGRVMNEKKVDKKIAKQEKKEVRKAEKKKATTDGTDDFAMLKEGPEFALSTFENLLHLKFLQEDNFEYIEFKFAEDSYINNRELMVIAFKTSRPIGLMQRYNGRIYLDKQNLAFVSIIYDEFIKIPVIFRPIIKMMMGVNIQSIESRVEIHRQLLQKYWYPRKAIAQITLNFKKDKIFKDNERLGLSRRSIFNVEKVFLDDVQPIIASKQYDPEKEYEEQIYPIDGVNWKKVNVIE